MTLEDRNNMRDAGICIGCAGQGWVQVIDPLLIQLYVTGGLNNETLTAPPVKPQLSGIARAVLCPLCQGSGQREQ
jgi:hypothetical protein